MKGNIDGTFFFILAFFLLVPQTILALPYSYGSGYLLNGLVYDGGYLRYHGDCYNEMLETLNNTNTRLATETELLDLLYPFTGTLTIV
jgi:hypothetical protein